MRTVCCAAKASLAPYVERRTDQQIVFSIGGLHCFIATPLVAAHDVFYFHWEEEDGELLNVIVDTVHRAEFSSCPQRDLLQTLAPTQRRPRWICAPGQGQVWAESLPNPLAGL